MTLPQVGRDFLSAEESDWSIEARRLADFLRSVDRHFEGQITLRLYGAAAVAFYTAGRAESMHMTNDVDVGHPGKLTWMIHDMSTAAHQPQNPFISLLDDALHRLRGSILGF